MRRPWFTIDDLRAAFSARAAGTPQPDLTIRIREATRPTLDRRFAVPAGWRRLRPNLARFAAISATAALLAVAASGVGQGLDQLVGRLAPGQPSAGALAAIERTEDEAEDKAQAGNDVDDADEADDEREADDEDEADSALGMESD